MASLVILDNAVHITEHPDAEIAPTRVPGNSGKTRSLNSIETEQPIPPRNGSLTTYQSPLRHHHRTPSVHRQVKETPNARSEYKNSQDDGKSQHHINQYIIGEEIGRGSFGAVHLAVDQYGQEYAVKEFSKSRLRKRARSNFFRRPPSERCPGNLAAGGGFNAPLHKRSFSGSGEGEEPASSLHLIKEEIAIMKKLHHPNLVSLIEVLDDPEEDSLYMVLEMCKKGVIMQVGLGERADPYDAESCRYWFRDMILGIEYLHAQGVAHRDIKPDNLLLTSDDVLKIVDFGVSEMFEKESEMMTAKSAGSPAFLPPELCVVRHGDVSGKAADIWSMGVSLYCLRFGHIPFEKAGVLELYEAIKRDDAVCTPVDDPNFLDLISRILEKDPKKRITMDELREHPWVTRSGTDPLLSKEKNVADLVELPTQIEMNHAITSNIGNLVIVMKAVNQFKRLLWKKHPERIAELFSEDKRLVQVPGQMHEADFEAKHGLQRAKSKRQGHSVASSNVERGVHDEEVSRPEREPGSTISESLGEVNGGKGNEHLQTPLSQQSNNAQLNGNMISDPREASLSGKGKGQARDPMDQAPPWLGIGAGAGEDNEQRADVEMVADSPMAADFNIYDTAYQKEVERIRRAQGQDAKIYLTRRVDREAEGKGMRI